MYCSRIFFDTERMKGQPPNTKNQRLTTNGVQQRATQSWTQHQSHRSEYSPRRMDGPCRNIRPAQIQGSYRTPHVISAAVWIRYAVQQRGDYTLFPFINDHVVLSLFITSDMLPCKTPRYHKAWNVIQKTVVPCRVCLSASMSVSPSVSWFGLVV